MFCLALGIKKNDNNTLPMKVELKIDASHDHWPCIEANLKSHFFQKFSYELLNNSDLMEIYFTHYILNYFQNCKED
jgi:hypothetical protein